MGLALLLAVFHRLSYLKLCLAREHQGPKQCTPASFDSSIPIRELEKVLEKRNSKQSKADDEQDIGFG